MMKVQLAMIGLAGICFCATWLSTGCVDEPVDLISPTQRSRDSLTRQVVRNGKVYATQEGVVVVQEMEFKISTLPYGNGVITFFTQDNRLDSTTAVWVPVRDMLDQSWDDVEVRPQIFPSPSPTASSSPSPLLIKPEVEPVFIK